MEDVMLDLKEITANILEIKKTIPERPADYQDALDLLQKELSYLLNVKALITNEKLDTGASDSRRRADLKSVYDLATEFVSYLRFTKQNWNDNMKYEPQGPQVCDPTEYDKFEIAPGDEKAFGDNEEEITID